MNIKVKINGNTYNAKKDEYILDVCKRNNIFVPTLCHHDGLAGIGSCRICVVEINEGSGNKTVISCVYPLSRDCEVVTNSDRIIGIRKTIISMLKSRAPDADGVISLCRVYDVHDDKRFPNCNKINSNTGDSKKLTPAQKQLLSSCILCGLCTKACESLGTGAISTTGRGVIKKVSTPYDEPSADCIGCGSCATVCPASAIECTYSKASGKVKSGKRIIWGREFTLIACASCGKEFATKDEYAFSLKKAASENSSGESVVSSETPALCDVCRKKKGADAFAQAFGIRTGC